MTTSGDEVRELLRTKASRDERNSLRPAKTFKEKYGSCEPAKELADWLTGQIPKTEEAIKKMEAEGSRKCFGCPLRYRPQNQELG